MASAHLGADAAPGWPAPVAAAALAAPLDVVRVDAGGITTRLLIDPDEACFAGHYPGFPILPGVLLIDTVDRSVRRYAVSCDIGPIELIEVRSVRFLAPVFPGDEVTADCTVKATGAVLAVNARCAIGHGAAASVRLRYRVRDAVPAAEAPTWS